MPIEMLDCSTQLARIAIMHNPKDIKEATFVLAYNFLCV